MIDQNEPPDSPQFLPLTKTMVQEIRYHWKRSGLPAYVVVRGLAGRGLSLDARSVQAWVSGRARHVPADGWRSVLDAYRTAPDGLTAGREKMRMRGYPPHAPGIARIEVTDEMHERLMAELARTGAEILLDIVQGEGAPEGLNERVVAILRHRTAKTVREDYWAFIMSALASMPDAP